MFSHLKKLFTSSPSQDDTHTTPLDETETQKLAFAALLIEAARADENFDEGERILIHSILQKQFDLTKDEVSNLFTLAEEAQEEAIDLHKFTKTLKTMAEDKRIQLIENLWQIVLSDDVRDPYEDALIRRVSSLIYITDRQSGEARQRVLAKL